jgi:hypothetical protein
MFPMHIKYNSCSIFWTILIRALTISFSHTDRISSSGVWNWGPHYEGSSAPPIHPELLPSLTRHITIKQNILIYLFIHLLGWLLWSHNSYSAMERSSSIQGFGDLNCTIQSVIGFQFQMHNIEIQEILFVFQFLEDSIKWFQVSDFILSFF